MDNKRPGLRGVDITSTVCTSVSGRYAQAEISQTPVADGNENSLQIISDMTHTPERGQHLYNRCW